jgi:hypothetical protein
MYSFIALYYHFYICTFVFYICTFVYVDSIYIRLLLQCSCLFVSYFVQEEETDALSVLL